MLIDNHMLFIRSSVAKLLTMKCLKMKEREKVRERMREDEIEQKKKKKPKSNQSPVVLSRTGIGN